jgi:hypothetical protein
MVMGDNQQPPAPVMEASAPQAAERPLWELNRDEQRMLIITFVGGLASIVGAACVVGGAIALSRIYGHWKPSGQWPVVGLMALLILLIVVGPVTEQALRRKQPGKPFANALRRLARIVIGMVLLIVALQLLAWIGLAAGIHLCGVRRVPSGTRSWRNASIWHMYGTP